MSQSVIIKNFRVFLNYQRDQLESLQQEETAHFESLQQSIGGFCFGFSVIHAAMDYIGKLAWWTDLLSHLCRWDGSLKTLEKEIALRGQAPTAVLQTKLEKIKLRTLFERALNYLIYNQASEYSQRYYGLESQRDHLMPEKNFFEILGVDRSIIRVQERKITAGYFERSHLFALFDEAECSIYMVLVHSQYHTIRVFYKKGKWSIYDSNHDHKKSSNMTKKFPNKRKFVEAIIKFSNSSLAIEIVNLDPKKNLNPFPSFTDDVAKRLQDYGFNIITQYIPNELQSILSKLSLRMETTTDASGIVPCSTPGLLSISQVNEIIIKALGQSTKGGWTGFQKIARHAPACLPTLFTMAEKIPQCIEIIIKALGQSTTDGWTGLHTIARYAPACLPTLFTMAEKIPQGIEIIIKALGQSTTDGWTGFQIIACYAPVCLPMLLTITNSIDEQEKLINMFQIPNTRGSQSALKLLLQSSPKQVLPLILKHIPKLLDAALSVLQELKNGGELYRQMVESQESLRICRALKRDWLKIIKFRNNLFSDNPSQQILSTKILARFIEYYSRCPLKQNSVRFFPPEDEPQAPIDCAILTSLLDMCAAVDLNEQVVIMERCIKQHSDIAYYIKKQRIIDCETPGNVWKRPMTTI